MHNQKPSIVKVILAANPSLTIDHAKAIAISVCRAHSTYDERVKFAEVAALSLRSNRESALKQQRREARLLG